MLQHGRGRREEHLDAAGQQIGDRLRAAGIGHVHHLHARHHLEQFGGKMRAGRHSRGGERQLVGLGLGEIDQFLDAFTPTDGCTTRMLGVVVSRTTGAKSLRKSKERLGVTTALITLAMVAISSV